MSHHRAGAALLVATILVATTTCDKSEPYGWSDLALPRTIVMPSRFDGKAPTLVADTLPLRVFQSVASPLSSSDGPASIEFLSDGGLVVAQRTRVTVFSANGAFAGDIGRQGEGPGEFRNIATTCMIPGDTLVIADMGRQRILIVDVQSRFLIREFRLPPSTMLSHQGCFEDRRLLMMDIEIDDSMRHRNLIFRRVNLEGDGQDLLRMPLSRERLRETGYPRFVADGDSWWLADPYFAEVARRTFVGELAGLIRFRELAEELSGLDALRARGLDVAKGSKLPPNARLAVMRRPFFGILRIAPGGTLWLQDRHDPEDPAGAWTLLNPTGKVQGRFRLDPARTTNGEILTGVTDSTVFLQRDNDHGDLVVGEYYFHPAGRGAR